jgi:hypothetical protein
MITVGKREVNKRSVRIIDFRHCEEDALPGEAMMWPREVIFL